MDAAGDLYLRTPLMGGESLEIFMSRRWLTAGIALIGTSWLVFASTVVALGSGAAFTAVAALSNGRPEKGDSDDLKAVVAEDQSGAADYADQPFGESNRSKGETLDEAAATEQIKVALVNCRDAGTADLGGKKMGDAGTKVLSNMLPSCKDCLQILLLSKNLIGETGATALAKVIQECGRLKRLDLSENQLGDAGLVALAPELPRCKNLQFLHLSQNQIGDVGARAFAAALRNCSRVQKLDLAHNYIGDDGARALALALPRCRKLDVLRLNENCINDDGAAALAEVLPACRNLRLLRLGMNDIGDKGAEQLAMVLKACERLQAVSLNDNRISEAGENAFFNATPGVVDYLDLNDQRLPFERPYPYH